MPLSSRRLAFIMFFVFAGCGRNEPRPIVPHGDAQRGAAAISRYGCGSCHTVPGLSDAHGLVGPPLTHIRDRLYVAGMLSNDPDHMVHWIRHPHAVNSRTAMPDLGVTLQDATDITAYLYSQ